MSYTSPSPTNVASNGNQTTWWIPARNLSSVKATNVTVQVTLTPTGGLAPVTYVADKGVFNFTTGVWQVGELAAGEVKWLKIVTSVADIGLAPYTLTSVISGNGVDPNNVNNTLVQTLTSVVCDASAGAVGDPNSCQCVDVSDNDTACTHGITEWRITAESIVNSTNYSWDEDTGKGHFQHDNPFEDITFTYSIWCGDGEDFVQTSGPATVTIPALFEDVAPFVHTADFVNGSTLSPAEIAILKAQPAYSAFTDEQIEGFCWEVIYDPSGTLAGGWAHQCTGTQDNRSFIFCSEEECSEAENLCPSCPYTDMPVDVSTYLGAIVDYTAQSGDNITVYHPGAISVYEYNGTAWVRSTCGCIQFLNNPYPVSFTITGGATKTATITLSDTTTLTTSFTDNDANTTYTMTLVNLLGINYVRLIDNSGNIVSSVMLPTSGGDCCCDCTFNLIPTQDGAIASTNCDITWTGPEANAIWEARPATGDEEDWITLDGGRFNGVYDNGATGLYIRVRYTIDSCERFSNIVTPLVCPCWTQIVFTDVINSFRLERENCGSLNIDDFEWQVRISFGVWETIQTGGTSINYTTLSEDPEFPEILIDPIVIRGKYTDPFGCVHFTDVQYITIP